MATLEELSNMPADSRWNDLVDKVKSAAIKKAVLVVDEPTSPTNRLDWAKAALENPNNSAQSVIWYVIGKNASATLTQIFGATDTAIETNVNSSIDAIYK